MCINFDHKTVFLPVQVYYPGYIISSTCQYQFPTVFPPVNISSFARVFARTLYTAGGLLVLLVDTAIGDTHVQHYDSAFSRVDFWSDAIIEVTEKDLTVCTRTVQLSAIGLSIQSQLGCEKYGFFTTVIIAFSVLEKLYYYGVICQVSFEVVQMTKYQ